MLRFILLFGFCLHLGLLSCGRFEHESKLSCASSKDCPKGGFCHEGFCDAGLGSSDEPGTSHNGPNGESNGPNGESNNGSNGESPGPEACAPQQLCGENCVDVQTNAAHCGECDKACPQGAMCQHGTCVACRNGEVLCRGRCQPFHPTMLLTPSYCGECSADCPACELGQCREACSPYVLTRAEGKPLYYVVINCKGHCVNPACPSFKGNCSACGNTDICNKGLVGCSRIGYAYGEYFYWDCPNVWELSNGLSWPDFCGP